METFKLIKLSNHKCVDGIRIMSGEAEPLNAANKMIKNLGQALGCEFIITQLYRVNFEDKEVFTTWEYGNTTILSADILVVELNHEWICVFASFGTVSINIMVDMRDGSDAELTFEYHMFEWIKSASEDTLLEICKVAGDRIAESEEEIQRLKLEYLSSLKQV